MHRAYGSGPSEKTGTTTGMDGVCQTESSDKATRSSSRQQERVEERSIVVTVARGSEREFPGCRALRHFSALRWPNSSPRRQRNRGECVQ